MPVTVTSSGGSQNLAHLVGSTYFSVQHLQNLFHSSGHSSGGAITDAGGNTIDVAAGTGLIRATDASLVELPFFDWPASAGLSVPSGTTRYVGIEYNGGTPQVVVKTTYTWDFNTDFPLGNVINDAGTLHIENAPHAVEDHVNVMVQRLFQTMPKRRDEITGGLILGETGTRNVSLTAGALWERLERFAIAAIDTSSAGTFDIYYQDGASGWTEVAGATQWPNTQYDDGSGTLATMTNNRYLNLWFYVELDGSLIMLYGQTQHVSEASAEAEAPPSTAPDRVLVQGILNGRIIFQKSAATAEAIESVYGAIFSGAVVTDHGNLAGLGDDDHTQYTLVDGTRNFTGDQSMGSNKLVAVSTPTEGGDAFTFATWSSSTPAVGAAGVCWMRTSDYKPFVSDGTRWLSWTEYRMSFNLQDETVVHNQGFSWDGLVATNEVRGQRVPFAIRVMTILIQAANVPAVAHGVELLGAASSLVTITYDGSLNYALNTTGFSVALGGAVRARASIIGATTPTPTHPGCIVYYREEA